jgi:hypothetical protein
VRIFEIEGKPLVPVQTVRFSKHFAAFSRTNPSLVDALADFASFKSNNPDKLHSRKDSGFTSGTLKGYRHEHLVFGKVVVIYQITKGQLRMCDCITHKEIDGAAKGLGKYLSGLTDASFHGITAEPDDDLSSEQRQEIMTLLYDLTQEDPEALRLAANGDFTSLFNWFEDFIEADLETILRSFDGKDGLRSEVRTTLRNIGAPLEIDLIEAASDVTEKFWVNTATGEIEMVFDHEDYGHIDDAIFDGYVQGNYFNSSNTFHLRASSVRTLSLALRAILTNHNSTKGCSYELLTGETGSLDYVGMMSVRNTATLPVMVKA